MYRCGIIGCGQIGVEFEDSHLRAYEDCLDTKLEALCDNVNGIPVWVSDMKYLQSAYRDSMSMVKKENLDIVSVCTPVETHCQIVCDIAPYVKAIYCEKPMATTLEECDKMIEVCRKHNVILQINHQRRFKYPVFRYSRGIINTGTHMFDLLRNLFGEISIVHVDASGHGVIQARDGLYIHIEPVDTDEPVFEFDCTHKGERLILAGVESLVSFIGSGLPPLCSGEDGKEALRLALEFKEMYNG